MSHSSPCKTKKCGCEDKGLHTPTPCIHDTFNCPNPDPCAETFSACCVIFNRDSILDTGFNNGDNLCTILQKISLWLTNPVCANPASACQSPLGLYSDTVSPTTITVKWAAAGGTPGSYQVEYKKSTDLAWSVLPAVPNTQLIQGIGALTSNTTYMIRVKAICDAGPVDTACYSVTILVTTKPTT
jgi:hypothetical protein